VAKQTAHQRKVIVLLLAVALGAWGGWQYYQQTEHALPRQHGANAPAAAVVPRAQPVLGAPQKLTGVAGHSLAFADLSGRPTLMYFVLGSCADECKTTLLKLAKLVTDWPQKLKVVVVLDSAKQSAEHWAELVAPYSDAYTPVVAAKGVLAEWHKVLSGTKPNGTLYVLNSATQPIGVLAPEQSVAQWLGALQGWLKE